MNLRARCVHNFKDNYRQDHHCRAQPCEDDDCELLPGKFYTSSNESWSRLHGRSVQHHYWLARSCLSLDFEIVGPLTKLSPCLVPDGDAGQLSASVG
jgi:hypothetical protein